MKKIIAYISSLALLILLFQNCAKPSPIEVNGRTSINGSLNKFEAPLTSGVNFDLENLETVSSELNDPGLVSLEHRVYITSVTDIANAPDIAFHSNSNSVIHPALFWYEIHFRTTIQVMLDDNGEWANSPDRSHCDWDCPLTSVIYECNYTRSMTVEEESQLEQLMSNIRLKKVKDCHYIFMDKRPLSRRDGHIYATDISESVVAFGSIDNDCYYNGTFESEYVYQDDTKEQQITSFFVELANKENLRIDPNHCGPPLD